VHLCIVDVKVNVLGRNRCFLLNNDVNDCYRVR